MFRWLTEPLADANVRLANGMVDCLKRVNP